MAQYYTTKPQVLEYLRGLRYGAYLERATNGKVVILVKVEQFDIG
jgi:hypothetical protein